MRVRKADAYDMDWLVDKVREHDRLMCYKRPLFTDEHLVAQQLTHVMTHHVLFVAEDDASKDLCGLIAGHQARHPFNPDIQVLSEILWWVEPSFRGKRAAAALLTAYTEYGRSRVDSIICSHVYDPRARASALENRGFRELERAYLLEV